MDQLTQYIEKFKDGLPELFENVLTSYQDKINSDFADEYDIPEHEYVQSHPLVQLNPNIYSLDSGLSFSDYKENCFKELHKYNSKITPLFTIGQILPKNEYIIMLNVKIDKDILRYDYRNGRDNNTELQIKHFSICYVSNYGRLINITLNSQLATINYYGNNTLNGYLINTCDYYVNDNKLYYKHNSQHIPNSNLAQLTYKFPKLFLDVINAFRNESTDDMQKCCEKYNVLLRKLNDKKVVRQLESLITEKDKIIEKMKKEGKKLLEQNKILQDEKTNMDTDNKKLQQAILEASKAKHLNDDLVKENTKLKKEIELLKLQMEEQRKLYMA